MKINKILNEASLENTVKQEVTKAANQIDNGIVAADKGDIEKALDRALKTSRRLQQNERGSSSNVLLIGGAGTGKTARVHKWAEENGINLFNVDAKTLDPSDMGGIVGRDDKNRNRATKLSSNEFDPLDRPNSVLFLDEFNRADGEVRGSLLELINDHVVNDNEAPSGKRLLPNFLFTVAAINPPRMSGGYNVNELDGAELTRFRSINVEADPRQTLDYLTKTYTKEMQNGSEEDKKEAEGRLRLADALLKDVNFQFADDEEEDMANDEHKPFLAPRSLTQALDASDGTKEDFLDIFADFCGPYKKGMVERILSNYQDKKDKANDALKGGSASSVFKKAEPSMWDKLGDLDI